MQASKFSEHSWEVAAHIPLLVKGFVGVTSLQRFENSLHLMYDNCSGREMREITSPRQLGRDFCQTPLRFKNFKLL